MIKQFSDSQMIGRNTDEIQLMNMDTGTSQSH